MSTIFKTWLNHREEEADVEINTLQSETQPDMVIGLQELLDRHTQGREVPLHSVHYDEDEEYIPDPRTLDLVDYDEALQQNKANIESLKQTLSAKQQSEGEASQAEKARRPLKSSERRGGSSESEERADLADRGADT